MRRQVTDGRFGLIHTGVCMDPWSQRTRNGRRSVQGCCGGFLESFLTGTSPAVMLLTFFSPYGT